MPLPSCLKIKCLSTFQLMAAKSLPLSSGFPSSKSEHSSQQIVLQHILSLVAAGRQECRGFAQGLGQRAEGPENPKRCSKAATLVSPSLG